MVSESATPAGHSIRVSPLSPVGLLYTEQKAPMQVAKAFQNSHVKEGTLHSLENTDTLLASTIKKKPSEGSFLKLPSAGGESRNHSKQPSLALLNRELASKTKFGQ